MRVAINIVPLTNGHKNRGIGYYTKNLIAQLEKDSQIELIKFKDISELKEVDLVHFPFFDLFYRTFPTSSRFKYIVTIHDVIPLLFPEHYPLGIKAKINFYLQKLALKKAKMIITDSKISQKDISKYLKIRENKIKVVPLAADSLFKPLSDTNLVFFKRKFNLPDKYILYVGDANWTKNLNFLLDAFIRIVKQDPLSEYKLILVGGVFLKNVDDINHPELVSLKELNKKIRDNKLEDKIIRIGNLADEELVALYNLATVYIQPSIYEGFGLPILQSFACGTPVISSTGGSLTEVGGKAAVYFNPNDLNQLVTVMSDILQNKSLRNKLSRLGLEQADKFSWQKTAEETKKVYQEALTEK